MATVQPSVISLGTLAASVFNALIVDLVKLCVPLELLLGSLETLNGSLFYQVHFITDNSLSH